MSMQTTLKSSSILAVLALCMALQLTSFVLILPLFARRFEVFGAGMEALGMSAMAYALTSIIAAPIIGSLADRYGRRPIILFSSAGYVLAFCGFLFASSAWLLILLRGLTGAFTAGLLPAMTGIVGDLVPENQRGRWLGVVTGGAAAGWIIGPLLGGLLYDRFGYAAAVAASIGMAAVALLLAAFLIPETHAASAQPGQPRASLSLGLRAMLARSTFLLLLLISFGVMFASAFIEPQFMFYVYDDLGWSSSQMGLVMSSFGAAFMIGAFTLGRSSDRLGRKPMLVLGLALFSAQFIGLMFFRDVIWIVVSFLLAGLGNALYDPALSAFVLDITPGEHTAGMIGLKNTAGSLGNLLGPALVVLITPYVSPKMIFLFAATLIFGLTLTAALAFRHPAGIKINQHYSKTTAML